jgi:hypothetical protein
MVKTITTAQRAALQTLADAGGEVTLQWRGKKALNGHVVDSLQRLGLASGDRGYSSWGRTVLITEAGRAALASSDS